MSAEQIEEEIITREQEMNIRLEVVDKWDQDHYISDEEEDKDYGLSRTTRARDRRAYIGKRARERQRRQGSQAQRQQLSTNTTAQETVEEETRQLLERRAENESQEIYEFTSSPPLQLPRPPRTPRRLPSFNDNTTTLPVPSRPPPSRSPPSRSPPSRYPPSRPSPSRLSLAQPSSSRDPRIVISSESRKRVGDILSRATDKRSR